MPSTYPKKHKIFIIAGENSGDLHGSNLVKEMLRLCPDVEFYGLGGESMERAGVNLLFNTVESLAIVGFIEVVTNIMKIKKVMNMTRDFLEHEKPDALILIDYPGFNLRMARFAHEHGIPVIYYICPQFWAWQYKRVKTIARYVDKLLSILPFEAAMLEKEGVNVSYVGHPLLDVMNITMNKEEAFEYFGFDPTKKLIGFLPGSRKSEVKRHLPVMLEAAEKIRDKIPDVQFVLPRATTIDPALVEYYCSLSPIDVTIIDKYRYNIRSTMDFAIVTSGTATLETAFMECPMVIVYKASYLSFLIAKGLVRLPYIGLVNIIAGHMLVPELLQHEVTPLNVAETSIKMLKDPETLEAIRYEMKKIKEKMGGAGASTRAANEVLGFLSIPYPDAEEQPPTP